MTDSSDDPLVQKALDRITELGGEIARLQQFVNQADRLNGREPRFGDTQSDDARWEAIAPDRIMGTYQRFIQKKWTPGSFYNKSLTAAVRSILTARHETAGEPSPASVDDIHEALTQGSFGFETSGTESQKNAIRISLGKNSLAFVKLPNTDLFGLVEWYGNRPRKPGRKAAGTNGAPNSADAQTGEGETAAVSPAAEVETDENKGG